MLSLWPPDTTVKNRLATGDRALGSTGIQLEGCQNNLEHRNSHPNVTAV